MDRSTRDEVVRAESLRLLLGPLPLGFEKGLLHWGITRVKTRVCVSASSSCARMSIINRIMPLVLLGGG